MMLFSRIMIGLCLSTIAWGLFAKNENQNEIVIGSKKFTENIIIAEIAAQLLSDQHENVSHLAGLGGTRILWSALQAGEISVYPEYTGTLKLEIFPDQNIENFKQLKSVLERSGIGVTSILGFNNTYVMGMLEAGADALSITTISDLNQHPQLKFAFSNEFMDRSDGWKGIRRHYQLPQLDVRGIDHDLAYRGLQSGAIDVMDLYSTDAEIQYYKIRSLVDDQHYFPDYHAVYLYRLDQEKTLAIELKRLAGLIDNETMVSMNAAVKIDGQQEQAVAAAFIKQKFGLDSSLEEITAFDRFIKNTRDHVILVAISLFAAIFFAIPLGILAARYALAGQFILSTASVLQTIPSLALFVFLIPVLGIGGPPTIVALFIYSLLPIVRNTYSGLHDIPASLRESAMAIGLPSGARLKLVELPLATRSILAGIKTSAVINVGTATLGALIGAGGYGQPILTGIRLDDTGLILEGAIPAALLALLVQALFELFERVILPKPLRYQAENKQVS